MKKRKTYEVSVIDKTYSRIISDETKFYTSDTALELVFKLKETEYTFESAEIVLLNINDKSLITRRVVKSDEGFVYTFEKDIIAHYGEWKAQLMFIENVDAHVASPIKFRIENDLYNTKPQELSDVVSWVNLKLYAEKLVGEFKQAVDEAFSKNVEIENTFKTNEQNRQTAFENAEQSRKTTFNASESERDETFNTNETTRQENEDARIEAEKQREGTVAQIENRQTFVENQFSVINQELTTKDIISAPEIIAARNGEANLKTRLDKEQQEVTAQLAQKVGLGKKAELEDLSPSVLSAIEGGEETSFNLLSIPQDNSVSWEKTTFMEVGDNLYDASKDTIGTLHYDGTVIDSTNRIVTDYISIIPGDAIYFTYEYASRGAVPFDNLIYLYDKNFTYLERLLEYKSGETIINSEAKYVRTTLAARVASNKLTISKKTVD